MKITLLGTGTPTPSLKRMSSGYLIEIKGNVILFDNGPGVYHRMMEAGVQAVDVTHQFFSHLHYDHCSDYVRLLLTRWDQGAGEIPELKVFGPPPIMQMTALLFSKEGAFGPDLTARTEHPVSLDLYKIRGGTLPRKWPQPEVRELVHGGVVEEKNWRVTVTNVTHAQPQLVCYSYRLDTEVGSFVYSGDSGPSPNMTKLAKDCDVLVHMCHYISGTEPGPGTQQACMGHIELAHLGKEANVRNLVISHITEQMDVPGIRERLLIEMSEIYKGNLIWGEDLMEIPLDIPQPRIYR